MHDRNNKFGMSHESLVSCLWIICHVHCEAFSSMVRAAEQEMKRAMPDIDNTRTLSVGLEKGKEQSSGQYIRKPEYISRFWTAFPLAVFFVFEDVQNAPWRLSEHDLSDLTSESLHRFLYWIARLFKIVFAICGNLNEMYKIRSVQ